VSEDDDPTEYIAENVKQVVQLVIIIVFIVEIPSGLVNLLYKFVHHHYIITFSFL